MRITNRKLVWMNVSLGSISKLWTKELMFDSNNKHIFFINHSQLLWILSEIEWFRHALIYFILSLCSFLKFIYSEKATKFCEISTNYFSYVLTASQIIGGDFSKFCGLLRIHEVYRNKIKGSKIQNHAQNELLTHLNFHRKQYLPKIESTFEMNNYVLFFLVSR